MVLILSSESDPHAVAVRDQLASMSMPVVILDLSSFPQESRLAITCDRGAGVRFGFQTSVESIDLGQCRSIWWRRPQQPQMDPQIRRSAYVQFGLSECHAALTGLWQSLNAFWINDPALDTAAQQKVYQLKIATELGLSIPDTLITNDPARAEAFVQRYGAGRVICKAFTATEAHWRETRLVRDDELAHIHSVKYAPVIFQEYIEAIYDLRITVIGPKVFAAAIHSQETEYKIDCRIDISHARIEAVDLPPKIIHQIREFMGRLGLVYGAIDMRLRPDGSYVFFEVNPAGQWLFIEGATGQPITECLARALARGGPDSV
ncbi:MAG TPA: alpha-L-glutamate ligase [Candidatus Paceibacterota bacterium]|nr:alpha-L-glutamate ligase [Candidatus Paceibacterota bacterium]